LRGHWPRRDGLERLRGVVELRGGLRKCQDGVVNTLHSEVFVVRLVERTENKRILEDLLDELVCPVSGITCIGYRPFDLGATMREHACSLACNLIGLIEHPVSARSRCLDAV